MSPPNPASFAPRLLPHPLSTSTSLPPGHDRQTALALSRNIPTSRLYRLPNEVLLHITSFLPLSAQLVLSITCQHLRRLLHQRLDLTVMLAFKSIVNSTQYIVPLENERQIYLSLVEPIDTPALWCTYCSDYHPRSEFTPHMATGWRMHRKCKNAEGVMWICPHLGIDHQSMRSIRHRPPHPNACSDMNHRVWMMPQGVSLERPIWFMPPGEETMAYGQLKELMRERRGYVCPHLDMDDKVVHKAAKTRSGDGGLFTLSRWQSIKAAADRAIDTSRIQLRGLGRGSGGSNTLDCREKRMCKVCGAVVDYVLRADRYLCLVVWRPFAQRVAVDHPWWVGQIVLREEAEWLEGKWREDERVFDRAMMRNLRT
ncbi:MAG: hypothetical protein Q9166_002363 [cf. Caloplaca sp. 2 TL-2023]